MTTTFATDFIAGWVSGCSGLLIGHPFDTVKTRLQTSNAYNGIFDCFRKTVSKESVRGLYKGMLAPSAVVGVMNSCMFVGYNQSLRLLHPGTERDEIPMLQVYTAQLIGTVVQLIPAIPVEHVKTKLQVQYANRKAHFRGPWHCVRELLETGGLRALYKGGNVQFWRDCIGYMFYFPVYEKGKREIKKLMPNGEPMLTTILAGGLAGSLSWWVICPIEVVKNRIQTSTSISSEAFLSTARSIYRTHGVRAFYKGGLVLLIRGFPVNAVVFVVYEKIYMAFGMHAAVALVLVVVGTAALDNGLLRTPPMGWMSWTKFYCETDCTTHPFACINEDLYMAQADRMSEDGYLNAGYEYVHIDDCWMARERDSQGRLYANKTRFPSGIKALSKYMHDRGLKLGIYEDYGTKTCGGYPGSLDHLKVDADTFAAWDADFLKFDGCWSDVDTYPQGYPEMGRMLNASGRPIAYSCSWPAYLIDQPQKQDYKLISKFCNVWRNFDDISMSWNSIASIINYYDHNQDRQIPYNGPGHWFDPDMIIGGNTEITYDQARTQMTIWSIWSAPLIMSNDLRTVDTESKAILLNHEVIAIDQDPMGAMGRLVANTSEIGVYVKPVVPRDTAKGLFSYAVAIFNRSNKKQDVEVQLSQIGLKNYEGYNVRDLWNHENLGRFKPTDSLKFRVNPTATAFVKCTLPNL